MDNIRKACVNDASRIAEILVFSKRTNYRHIFNDDTGSFVELQVYPLAKDYIENPELLNNTFVFDDKFVKGMIHIDGSEIKELYVDPFFEKNGIGGNLLEFVIAKFNCYELWVLDQNEKAILFYEEHGFRKTKDTRPVPEAPESMIIERRMVK